MEKISSYSRLCCLVSHVCTLHCLKSDNETKYPINFPRLSRWTQVSKFTLLYDWTFNARPNVLFFHNIQSPIVEVFLVVSVVWNRSTEDVLKWLPIRQAYRFTYRQIFPRSIWFRYCIDSRFRLLKFIWVFHNFSVKTETSSKGTQSKIY